MFLKGFDLIEVSHEPGAKTAEVVTTVNDVSKFMTIDVARFLAPPRASAVSDHTLLPPGTVYSLPMADDRHIVGIYTPVSEILGKTEYGVLVFYALQRFEGEVVVKGTRVFKQSLPFLTESLTPAPWGMLDKEDSKLRPSMTFHLEGWEWVDLEPQAERTIQGVVDYLKGCF
jgi:hypothetical protein